MIRAVKFSVFIFAVILAFHCCNGRYLLVETEDDTETNEEGDDLHLLEDLIEDETTSNSNRNIRNCDFCEPDVPGVPGHGIGK